MRGQKDGACHRRRPVSRAPSPRGEREAGDEKRNADVLDEMRVEGAGFGDPWNALVPVRTGSQHRQPVKEGGYCENCCYQTPHGNLLRPRRARRGGCDRTGQRNFRAISGANSRPARSAIWSEFCSWQAGQDSVNNRFRACWQVAGTSVRAFRKPDMVGDHSFQDIRMDCSKGRKTHRFGGVRQGSSGVPDGLDPVRDCRRRR